MSSHYSNDPFNPDRVVTCYRAKDLPYHVLCLSKNATKLEIKTRFRKCVMLWHTDKVARSAPNLSVTTEAFQAVTEAYQTWMESLA